MKSKDESNFGRLACLAQIIIININFKYVPLARVGWLVSCQFKDRLSFVATKFGIDKLRTRYTIVWFDQSSSLDQ